MPDIVQEDFTAFLAMSATNLYKNKHITTGFYKNVKENNAVITTTARNMKHDPT
jgi:hypothetical protein